MTLSDIRNKYLTFFAQKGHTVIPSSSLVPENDPTTLFTGSGMQPLLPYLLGQQHPEGARLVDSQKCFRAEDIDEVGDNRHTTFFEMLGNWSLGDYFKQEQLAWFFAFLTDEVGLDPAKIYVTVFAGDPENGIPRDDESVAIWQHLFRDKGIDATVVHIGSETDGATKGMQGGRIFYYDAAKNWWSRSGTPDKMPVGEPGGPDSEVFYDFGLPCDPAFGDHCHPNCDCGRFMEIGNSVFMEYIKNDAGGFDPLPQKNVDFGGGLERIAAAAQGNADVFTIDVFATIIAALEQATGKTYADAAHQKAFRIVADHLRGAVFMIGEGVVPANTDQGYVVRRLLRRCVRYGDQLGLPEDALAQLVGPLVMAYAAQYPGLADQAQTIAAEIRKEEGQFRTTLAKGLREFEKRATEGSISGKDAFVLFTTYGFPLEMTQELAAERDLSVDTDGFNAEMAEHQALSRTASSAKFKGGLADQSEKTTMLHTATHLMLAGLRKYLGDHVHQKGSNITQERSRFDFTHPEKVDRETLDKVEAYVNEAIAKSCDVTIEQMDKQAAQDAGVEGSFWEKYPDTVDVYVVKAADGTVYSQELCGGPHVKNTGDITGAFKITKEQSSSAGVRRVKAVLE